MPNSATTLHPDAWRKDVDHRLKRIEDNMATKADILQVTDEVMTTKRTVDKHERLLGRGKNVLMYLGIATLLAALFSPHATWVKQWLQKVLF